MPALYLPVPVGAIYKRIKIAEAILLEEFQPLQEEKEEVKKEVEKIRVEEKKVEQVVPPNET